jgi:hypothetical protein
MRGERSLLFNRQIRLMITEDLDRAVHAAATKDLMSMSEYCRRAIVERLRNDRTRRQENEAAA